MAYQNILVDVRDGIGELTLNRPQKLNAYTVEMGEEITRVLRAWRSDPLVRAVVVTGAGRAFCAGVDLDHLKQHRAGEAPGTGPKLGEEDFLRALPLELCAYPKPLIAALPGAAVGVGVTMTLPFDLRLAAEDAGLSFAFVKLGLLPGLGSTHLLPRIVGRARALELVLSARMVRAPEALQMGLVNRVLPGPELLPAARELAATLAAYDEATLEAAKAALAFGSEHGMEESMRFEERISAELRNKATR